MYSAARPIYWQKILKKKNKNPKNSKKKPQTLSIAKRLLQGINLNS